MRVGDIAIDIINAGLLTSSRPCGERTVRLFGNDGDPAVTVSCFPGYEPSRPERSRYRLTIHARLDDHRREVLPRRPRGCSQSVYGNSGVS